MKKQNLLRRVSCVVSTCMLVMLISTSAVAAEETDDLSNDEFLRLTGMPQEEINNLDPDIKAYIVEDLQNHETPSELEYWDSEKILSPTTRVNQKLTGITFDAEAFESGNRIYIYPTYEFTTDKKPVGEDSFSILLGNAFESDACGG